MLKLTPASGLLKPLLTVEFIGDLQLAAIAAPLPGALPLFMTGLAVLGLVSRRRRSRPAAERRRSA